MAKAPTQPLNLGSLIDRYTGNPPKIDTAGRKQGYEYRLAFVEYLKQEAGLAGDLAVRQALEMKPAAFRNWMDPQKDIRRETLEGISEAFSLTPSQRLGLWSIANGNLSRSSPAAIANRVKEGISDPPLIPDSTERGKRRVDTFKELQTRTGLSDNVFLEKAGYSKPFMQTLRDAAKDFHNIGAAHIIGQVFVPDDNTTAHKLGLLMLGYREQYTAQQYATMLETGVPPKEQVIVLAREQHFHTAQQLADALDISIGAVQRWESQSTEISDATVADKLAQYLGAPRFSPIYDRLTHALMGTRFTSPLNAVSGNQLVLEGGLSKKGPSLKDWFAQWLSQQPPHTDRTAFAESLAAQMSDFLRQPVSTQRTQELMQGTGDPISMAEQTALLNRLSLSSADRLSLQSVFQAINKARNDELPDH